ncbi:hypothetical protein CRG98_042543 [Punica granatum]|uniref:F-box domain-containing protein n=1 Tax=Punica granatum TaxID=22663 RepID=A0A2I0HZB9_PUNGR|nr:hypothetical protein CRG98_042543 [Punica granatum]
MANLPEEITMDILLRLPVKSLVRFRCVCKHWNRLFNSPAFVKAHRTWKLESRLLLKYCSEDVTRLGIRCQRNTEEFSFDISPPSVIGKKFELPPSPVPEYLVGFGFNPLSAHLDDFKVICINLRLEYKDRERKRHSQVEVYSLRTNSWKQLGDRYPSYLNGHLGNQVIFNEFICWYPYVQVNKQSVLTVFDVAKEEFHEMRLPNSMPSDGKQIGLVDGCVSLWAHNPSEGYEVWTMKVFGNLESWTKLYTIKIFARSIARYQPLGLASVKEALLLNTIPRGLRHRNLLRFLM